MKYQKVFFSSLMVLTIILLVANFIFLISINKASKNYHCITQIRKIDPNLSTKADANKKFRKHLQTSIYSSSSLSPKILLSSPTIKEYTLNKSSSRPVAPFSEASTYIVNPHTTITTITRQRLSVSTASTRSASISIAPTPSKAIISNLPEKSHSLSSRGTLLSNSTGRTTPQQRVRRRPVVLLYPWSSGRLGNLMFIWASVSAIARHLNVLNENRSIYSNVSNAVEHPKVVPVLDRSAPITLVFPPEQLEAHVVDKVELQGFAASGMLTTRLEESTIMFDEALVHTLERETAPNTTAVNLTDAQKSVSKVKLVRTFAASGRQGTAEETLSVSRVFRMIGYFQSWRYFEPQDRNHTRICDMFRFASRVEARALSIAADIKAKWKSSQNESSNASSLVLVAVHIRRRDYVNFYGIRVPDVGIIEEAMSYFHDKYLNVYTLMNLQYFIIHFNDFLCVFAIFAFVTEIEYYRRLYTFGAICNKYQR